MREFRAQSVGFRLWVQGLSLPVSGIIHGLLWCPSFRLSGFRGLGAEGFRVQGLGVWGFGGLGVWGFRV